MNDYVTLFIPKYSHTYADDLLAYGVGRVARSLLYLQEGDDCEVRIEQFSTRFEISLTPPLRRDSIQLFSGDLPFMDPILKRNKSGEDNASQLPDDLVPIDYDQESKKNAEYREIQKKAVKGQSIQKEPPSPYLAHFSILVSPFMLQSYNTLISQWWNCRAAQPELLYLLLDLFTDREYLHLEKTEAKLAAINQKHGFSIPVKANAKQLFSPSQGKGTYSAKASGIVSPKWPQELWLLHWLRALGFYELAFPQSIKISEDHYDKRVLVASIRNLSVEENVKITSEFQNYVRVTGGMSLSEIQSDILTIAGYTRTLLRFFLERKENPRLRGRFNVSQKLVAGFHRAYFKSLGKAPAVTNISFIALPNWIAINDASDIRRYIALLDEIAAVTRHIDENHSGTHTMLSALRRFLSGNDLKALFRFCSAFSAHYMGTSPRDVYLPKRLSTITVERIIMSSNREDLTAIVQNPGFQNIAAAIRKATTFALYKVRTTKTQTYPYPYSIRYGLSQELLRVAAHKDKFVATIGKFLGQYNAETALINDRMQKRLDVGLEVPKDYWRTPVDTEDINEIVRLIVEFGSQPVANLLVAYGYAKSSHQGNQDKAPKGE